MKINNSVWYSQDNDEIVLIIRKINLSNRMCILLRDGYVRACFLKSGFTFDKFIDFNNLVYLGDL